MSPSYIQYKQDIEQQKKLNDARAADPNAYPDELSTCAEPAEVNAAIAEINRVSQNTGSPQSAEEQNKYYSQQYGTLRCTAEAVRKRKKDYYGGDEYDKNGYVGRCQMQVNRPLTLTYHFNWTYSNVAPPPAPNV